MGPYFVGAIEGVTVEVVGVGVDVASTVCCGV